MYGFQFVKISAKEALTNEKTHTIKPVLKGHLWDTERVVF
jgi:hypothetical protein